MVVGFFFFLSLFGIVRLGIRMAIANGPQVITATAPCMRTFADMVLDSSQPLPEVVVPFRSHKTVDGEVCVVFSKEEIDQLALPFQFSLVLKFLR